MTYPLRAVLCEKCVSFCGAFTYNIRKSNSSLFFKVSEKKLYTNKMIVSDTFAEFQGLISENCAHRALFLKKNQKKTKIESPCH